MPIGAALCYAGTILTTRRLCREESPITLSFGVGVTFLAVGVAGVFVFSFVAETPLAAEWPYLLTGWHSIGLWVLALIATCSVLNLTANIALGAGVPKRRGELARSVRLQLYRFRHILGVCILAHIPDELTFLGMAMIAGSGAFVAWREKAAAQSTAKTVGGQSDR